MVMSVGGSGKADAAIVVFDEACDSPSLFLARY
jgi:hypothetical protein